MTLIDTGVGIAGCILGLLFRREFFGGEEIGQFALLGLLYALAPAIIVALMARKRRKR